MDELTIDDKKYVSSKHAAKLSGYAQDYIGQLCREGRIPARLVGRSWYVLESALKDHRFGKEEKEEPKEEKNKEVVNEKKEEKTEKKEEEEKFASPRYEPITIEPLPMFKETHGEEDKGIEEITEPEHKEIEATVPVEQSTDTISAEQPSIHDAWNEWFGDTPRPENAETAGEAIPIDKMQETENDELWDGKQEAEAVPIHATKHFDKEITELAMIEKASDESLRTVIEERSSPILTTIRVAGIGVAAILVGLSLLATGYFDRIISSHPRASYFAGVAIYIK